MDQTARASTQLHNPSVHAFAWVPCKPPSFRALARKLDPHPLVTRSLNRPPVLHHHPPALASLLLACARRTCRRPLRRWTAATRAERAFAAASLSRRTSTAHCVSRSGVVLPSAMKTTVDPPPRYASAAHLDRTQPFSVLIWTDPACRPQRALDSSTLPPTSSRRLVWPPACCCVAGSWHLLSWAYSIRPACHGHCGKQTHFISPGTRSTSCVVHSVLPCLPPVVMTMTFHLLV